LSRPIYGRGNLSFATERQKYIQGAYQARQFSEQLLSSQLGVNFNTSEWSGRTFEALRAQWGNSVFDWERIAVATREPSRFDAAVWVGDRLCCLLVATLGGEAVTLRWVEGDPRPECPLKGRRLLIALDLVTNYAQANGRYEIRAEPLNSAMVNLFETDYGFHAVKAKGRTPYWRKQV